LYMGVRIILSLLYLSIVLVGVVKVKAVNLWDDETLLRHVTPPEEDRGHIYPSTGIKPRWFRSPNIIPIERHERFRVCGLVISVAGESNDGYPR
jgi:hypothetical protein